ncbi:hypothetical protein [Gordonia aurantiaca]|uniref:hypothetical protein n=1 Tax=Gordonia sp. B21 TaxID=3151852 RepID=UPI00326446B7
MKVPTIVTAACVINRGDLIHKTGLVVLEVANPGQVSAELALLKRVTFADRQKHIEDVTGCPTSDLGVSIETPARWRSERSAEVVASIQVGSPAAQQ